MSSSQNERTFFFSGVGGGGEEDARKRTRERGAQNSSERTFWMSPIAKNIPILVYNETNKIWKTYYIDFHLNPREI